MQKLLETGAHLGSSKIHQKFLPFLYGKRNLPIINLDQTLACLRRAINVTRQVSRNGNVVFLGTRPMLHKLTVDCALLSNQHYIIHWIGGTLTNDHVLRRNATRKSIDLVIMLDYCNTAWAVRECNQKGIPVIAICDTDCDPSKVQYPIPANDDNLSCVSLIAQALANAAKEGYDMRDASQ